MKLRLTTGTQAVPDADNPVAGVLQRHGMQLWPERAVQALRVGERGIRFIPENATLAS